MKGVTKTAGTETKMIFKDREGHTYIVPHDLYWTKVYKISKRSTFCKAKRTFYLEIPQPKGEHQLGEAPQLGFFADFYGKQKKEPDADV